MSDKKFGYIDNTGKFVIKPTFDKASPFSGKLARVETGEKVAFIDRSGTVVFGKTFDYALGFSGDFAAINQGGKIPDNINPIPIIGGKWGFINRQGVQIIDFKF